MSEFTKNKIAFAIALLATLFTISPVTSEIGTWGYFLFGFHLEVRHLYYFLAAFLTLAVYSYGIEFLIERPMRFPQALADVSYAIALVAPPLYLVLYLLLQVTEALGSVIKNQSTLSIISMIFNLFGILSATKAGQKLFTVFARREKKSEVQQLEKEELSLLNRGKLLFEAGHFDLCVVECFKAIEVTLRRAFLQQGLSERAKSIRNTIDAAADMGIIPEDLIQGVVDIRHQRNKAAHGIEPISRMDAASAIETTNRVLAAISASIGDDTKDAGDAS